jgi:ribonuclease HI
MKAMSGSQIVIYADGACSGNPGPGGWAWAVAPDGVRHDSGGEAHTTNQRMELTAVLQAIRMLGDDATAELLVVSDSQYVVNCDLWEPLIDLVRNRGKVEFRWVKGHSGDPMNDLVDELAVRAIAAVR